MNKKRSAGWGGKAFDLFNAILMTGIVIVMLYPFWYILVGSVSSVEHIYSGKFLLWPDEFQTQAYEMMLKNRKVAASFLNSVFVTIVGTLTSLMLTTLYAYPLSRKNLPGRNIFAFYIFFTMLFNGGLVPGYMMWTQMFHIKNTIFALIVPGLLLNAFNVIMMRTYFTTNIPEEVLEAARIDGGGELYILTKVVLPMSKPIIVTLVLLIGLTYWNDWLNGLYYVNRDNLYSIQVLLKKMMDDIEMIKKASAAGASTMKMPSISIRMAVAVMGALPIMCVYPFFQKYFVKGIVIGAVKG